MYERDMQAALAASVEQNQANNQPTAPPSQNMYYNETQTPNNRYDRDCK